MIINGISICGNAFNMSFTYAQLIKYVHCTISVSIKKIIKYNLQIFHSISAKLRSIEVASIVKNISSVQTLIDETWRRHQSNRSLMSGFLGDHLQRSGELA